MTASLPLKSDRKVAAPGNASTEIENAFPTVNPEVEPLGSRVLVQIRKPKEKSAGGIILTANDRDAEKWNTQIGVIRALGPVAFHNRTTLAEWPEGAWCKPGDFVRVPKYGGDRFEISMPNNEKALFVLFNDLDLVAKITGDPLKIIAFV